MLRDDHAMRGSKAWIIALTLSIVALTVGLSRGLPAFGAAPSMAPEITVRLEPTTINLGLNDIFEVDIRVDAGDQPLSLVQVFLDFDPDDLQVQDGDSQSTGINIRSDKAKFPIVLANSADNDTGQITYVSGKLGGPYPSGSFVIATIEFRAVGANCGGTGVTFVKDPPRRDSFADITGTPLTTELVDAKVMVGQCLTVVRPSADSTVRQGDTFDVVVEADSEGVTDLAGAQFHLNYDPTVLTSLLPGTPGPDFAGCLSVNNDIEGDEPPPLIRAVTLTLACTSGRSGNPLHLWTIPFQAAAVAQTTNTELRVTQMSLKDSVSATIPSFGASTTIVIIGPPPPVGADLSIAQTALPDLVFPGETLTYTMTMINNGPDTATGVMFIHTLEGDMSFLPQEGLQPIQASCNKLSDTTTCSLGTLANGERVIVVIAVTPKTDGIITSTASVASDTFDPDLANNTTTETTTTGIGIDLAITKTDSADPVAAGSDLTYTLTVTNAITGAAVATGVLVIDTLPDRVTFKSATPSQGIIRLSIIICSARIKQPSRNCPVTGATVAWDVGNLFGGQSETLDIVVTVDPDTPDGAILVNRAVVGGDQTDPDPGNNTAEEDTIVMAAAFSCSGVTEIPQEECQALVALYVATDGPGWDTNVRWLATDSPCSWRGVSCDGDHVTELNLSFNQLSGAIPPELGGLSSLQKLRLGFNQLSGVIPPELGGLTSLMELQLDLNQLSGTIPPELGGLANLQTLSLCCNQLSGAIPTELRNLTSLRGLWLFGNQLNGVIPPELGGLANLQSLGLSDNQLNGVIPPELGGLASLQSLGLSHNQLNGAIPQELGNLSSLRQLYLYYNQLSGVIPTELGGLGSLEQLLLNNNQLSGVIPTELGNLPSLQELRLYNNQLSGAIPRELGNFASLRELTLSDNPLKGALPQSMTNIRFDSPNSRFWFDNTALCEPPDEAFQQWLDGIPDLRSTGWICADLNGDRSVDIVDPVAILQISVGAVSPTDQQRVTGDVNQDGDVNVFDAIIALQYIVGLIPTLEAG